MALRLALALTLLVAVMATGLPAGAADDSPPMAVMAFNDGGINPYHEEFSAASYPDADVLALTDDFTRHPSEYLPGYPADAEALPVTLGQGFLPPQDESLFTDAHIRPGKLYWIPGTKIVGVVADAAERRLYPWTRPLLDAPPSNSQGHGTMVASIGAGNSLGTCRACLVVAVQAREPLKSSAMSWVDITSNSYLDFADDSTAATTPTVEATRAAAQRGQITVYAAGNGNVTPFLVPLAEGHNMEGQGPSWNVRIGGTDRDSGRALMGDQLVVDASSYALGTIPAAASNSSDGIRNGSGTSGAAPMAAGVFASALVEARRLLGDGGVGQGPDAAVAQGSAVAASPLLADGVLHRHELLAVGLKTAASVNTDPTTWQPSSQPTAPYHEATQVLVEGYGTVDEASLERARDVLHGRATLPQRDEDEFFRLDYAVRDTRWGPCGCFSHLDVGQ